jgi:hypothetical protein
VLAAGVLAVFVGVLSSILIRTNDQPTSAAERKATPTATAAPAKRAATTRTTATATAKRRARAKAASAARKPKTTAVKATRPAARVIVPAATAAPLTKKKAAAKPKATPKRTATGNGGQQETRAGKQGAGLPQQPGAPGATPTPVPDSCDSQSPDCQSG